MTVPRCVVVGRGAVTCFGAGAAALLDAVFAGERGVRPRRRLAGFDCPTGVAAEVPAAVEPGADGLALWCARAAAEEALHGLPPRPTALVLASTKGDLGGIDAPPAAGREPGLGSPLRLGRRLWARLGLTGPLCATSCACASGLAAIALGDRLLRRGGIDRVLVVGVDALAPFVLAGFGGLLALDPGPCRPFDRDRRGLSLGEGAGALVLERAAGGTEFGALLGYGERNDANHVTGPSRDGDGLARAIGAALRHAGLPAAAVDAVHLHGTGTEYNDAMEGRALHTALGGARPVAFGSKAQIGHTLGAAGVLETMIALEALRRREVPGNLGLEHRDPAIELPLSARPTPLPRAEVALELAAGFGGIDVALVLGRRSVPRERLPGRGHRPGRADAGRDAGTPAEVSAAPSASESARRLAIGDRCGLGVAAFGAVDAAGVAGTGARLALAAPGEPLAGFRWRDAFAVPFADYRRLDPLSRAVAIAVEASTVPAGVDRDRAALVLATEHGCLAADLRFAGGLGRELEPKVFPFTLPSTCLGVVAIRHRLRGALHCLSTAAPADGTALARDLLAAEDASAVLLCCGDWVGAADAAAAGIEPVTRMLALWLLRTGGDDGAVTALEQEGVAAAARVLGGGRAGG